MVPFEIKLNFSFHAASSKAPTDRRPLAINTYGNKLGTLLDWVWRCKLASMVLSKPYITLEAGLVKLLKSEILS